MAFFNALKLETVSGPLHGLVGQVFEFVPKLVAGGGVAVSRLGAGDGASDVGDKSA